MRVLVGVPIKSFGAAKARLAGDLDQNRRRTLAQFLAAHTLTTLDAVGIEPIVMAGDAEVATFASSRGFQVVAESGGTLNQSATQLRAKAVRLGTPWMILHADLPYLTGQALDQPLRALGTGHAVITASPDGGTPLLGGGGQDFEFAYGPASFHRHLRQVPRALVLMDPRLSCDIDRPIDLEAARGKIEGISTLLDS